jgi:6-phosphogluconolactonase
MIVYIGAYTEPPLGKAEGISVYRFDDDAGALDHVQTVSGIKNPSFLAVDPNNRFLYAVSELEKGGVFAFACDSETGELTLLNSQSSHGADPCYISLDPSGRYVLVANYSGGTVAVLPIAADGSLEPASDVVRHEGSSVHPTRQERAHPHMVAPTPDGRFILVTDLGTDRVHVYELDTATGRLEANQQWPGFVTVEAGSGPRHFAFAPNSPIIYVINELASTLAVYRYDIEREESRLLQTVSSLPDGFTGENTCAQVVVAPDGRFVYGSNRGHDSIAIWAVDENTGEVKLVGHESTRGKGPRHFTIDPTGSWLLAANEKSDSVVTYRRNPDSGMLDATGPVNHVPTPVAIVFGRQ